MPETEMTMRHAIETLSSRGNRTEAAAHVLSHFYERGLALDRTYIDADEVLKHLLQTLPETHGVLYATDLAGCSLDSFDLPPLSSSLIAQLARSRFDIARVVSCLFMMIFPDSDNSSEPRPQLATALTRASQWVSLHGLVRAARLLAGTRRLAHTSELELLSAFLLTMSLTPWTEVIDAVDSSLAPEVLEWHRHMFQTISRSSRIEAVWEAALVPSDSLAPLPASGKLEDFRLKGATIDWVTRCARYGAGAHFVGTELPPPPTVREMLAAIVGEHSPGIHELLPIHEEPAGPAFHTCLFPGVSWKGAFTEGARVLHVTKSERGQVRRLITEWQTIQQKEDERLMRTGTIAAHAPNVALAEPASSYAQIVQHLESKIVGHRDAIRRLAMLADSNMRDAGVAARALLIGPSGCGKSTLLKELARSTGRVYVQIDASQITENGWKGLNTDHIAAMVVAKAGGDHEKARWALVVLDEIDKLRTAVPLPSSSSASFESERVHEDPHGAAVRVGRQEGLLSLLDPEVGVLTYESEKEGAKQIETKNWLVVCAGAFRGLDYQGRRPSEDTLVSYGFIPEFVTRMGQRIVLPPPTPNHIFEILRSSIGTAHRLAAAHKKELTLTSEAIQLVASRVAAGQLSIRGAKSTLEEAAQSALIAALEHLESNIVVGPDEVISVLPTPRHPGSRRQVHY